MKSFFDQSKYKLGRVLCLVVALFVTYLSISALYGGSVSGQAPNVMLHVGAFLLTIFLVILSVYFGLKDRQKH